MPLPARAIHFMGLNVVRVLTLISLILVFASTILVMVTNINGVNAFEANKGNNTNDTMIDCDYIEGTTVPNQPAGVFWAIVASLLIIFQTIILFFSEVSWPMKFFDKYFPVLGTKFGLGPLGIFQCLISTQILSHHVDDFTLVAGFFQFALGILNMLLGVGYRESAKSRRSITSWRAEAKGILPTSVDANRPIFINATPGVGSGQFSRSPSMQEKGLYPNGVLIQQETHTDAQSWKSNEKAGFGFGRQGEKAAGLRGFILQKPEESLPRYVSPAPAPAPTLSRTTSSSSGSSSFYSPERPNMPLPNRQQQQREGSRHSRTESDDSSHHDHPPTFKSSRTAI